MKSVLETAAVDHLEVEEQVRRHFAQPTIDSLAASIREVGLQQPIIARKEGDRLIVLDGERRLRACRQLGIKEVPVLIVSDVMTIADLRLRQLTCNLQREDLSPIDRAESVKRLMETGSLTADEVARRLGFSPATISRTLSVLKLPEGIRDQIATGAIPADTGYLLARIEEPAQQEQLAAEVSAGRLSRDALTRKLKRLRRAQEQSGRGPNRVTALLGSGRSVTVAAKSMTFDTLIEVLDQLLARAKKSKSQGISLSTFLHTLRDQAA